MLWVSYSLKVSKKNAETHSKLDIPWTTFSYLNWYYTLYNIHVLQKTVTKTVQYFLPASMAVEGAYSSKPIYNIYQLNSDHEKHKTAHVHTCTHINLSTTLTGIYSVAY